MGDLPILAELEIVQDGKGLQVEFAKIDGIISHTICLVNANEKTPVLTSHIDELTQPCFTQLHQQDEMLFLTGANGPCHWSMSVSKGSIYFKQNAKIDKETLQLLEQRYGLNAPHLTEPTPLGDFLHFDIACRLKQSITQIGNKYLALDDYHCGRSICACSAVNMDEAKLGMLLLGGPESYATFSPAVQYSMDCVSDRDIFFSPKDVALSLFPITLRWSYGVWRMI